MTNDYYQKHNERLREEARKKSNSFWRREKQKAEKAWERYQNLTEEEEKKRQYHRELNKNLSVEQKRS